MVEIFEKMALILSVKNQVEKIIETNGIKWNEIYPFY